MEFETQKLIRETLIEFGIPDDIIKVCAETGLTVDIWGTGKPLENQEKGAVNALALRADMDGLPMPEANQKLEYASKTEFAHMCGHDGHMATLLSAAKAMWSQRHNMPSNKFVRLLFQPAEEGPGGALPMIEEGCLDNIDEVYGYHNIPNFDEGDIRVIDGGIFAESTSFLMKILGQGGHGSAPHRCVKDPITAATAVINSLHSIKSRNIDSSKNITFSICQMESGTTGNVFPDEATIRGTIRSYDAEEKAVLCKRIREIVSGVTKAHECDAEVDIWTKYPPVVNHTEQTNHVIRLAKKYIGEAHFSQDELPMAAGEDFSYFLQHKPGCFFLLGTMKEGETLKTLHTSNYDYNDDLIATGAFFFLRIVQDRLGCTFFDD